MGDNNLFCVIFQKEGDVLKPIYHGRISSSVIDRSGSGSDMGSVGASGKGLPNFNPEHFKNATFTDTGDITIDSKTFKNPFQNFDVSKLERIDKAQFQGLITELTSAETNEDRAKIGMKFATTIGKEIPEAKQYVELMTKFAGTPGAAKAVGTFAKATQPMVKIAVGMALKHHPGAKNLPTEVHDALIGFADNFSSVVANNAEDAVSILGEVAKQPGNADANENRRTVLPQSGEEDAANPKGEGAAASNRDGNGEIPVSPTNLNKVGNGDEIEEAPTENIVVSADAASNQASTDNDAAVTSAETQPIRRRSSNQTEIETSPSSQKQIEKQKTLTQQIV